LDPAPLVTTYVALLRAINIGGASTLPMRDLAALCTRLGFENVRTYIQSGNVIFRSSRSGQEIVSDLEGALAEIMGKPMNVILRTAQELRRVWEGNPFPNEDLSRVLALFLTHPVPENLLDHVTVPGPEKLRLAEREIYIHYPDGMGRSKLKIPPDVVGTGRNMNTIAKLVSLTA
jgi:uncharacterized protein (DUF1697 family)